ncbi:hypothetical protein [Frankia sp. R43]|uniref:hypothetical protein n=1 Tax=Frankia sp. R43 TaxID=269536 RepID=UPI000A8FE132|nr:hypothetical protein [Frankia sp. R43]
MATGLTVSGHALRWAARCYRDNAALLVALAAAASLQRFGTIRYGDELPAAIGPAGEALTGLTRIAVIAVALRALAREPELAPLTPRERLDLFGSAAGARRRALVAPALLLAAAFVIFDVIPNAVITLRVEPADRRELIQAILVAVKNPTVIVLTMLWMVGLARELMTEHLRAAAR